MSVTQMQRLEAAAKELDQAVAGLRRVGDVTALPLGLLTRSWIRYLTGARVGPDSAQADLDEAWEIASRGPMRLFMADVLLTRARLFGEPVTPGPSPRTRGEGRERDDEYPWESVAADLAAAEKLINECGYHRRDEELADAKRALLGTPS